MPTFGFDSPSIVAWMPREQVERRVQLGSDQCVVDDERYLVYGCLEIPVWGESEPFVWGVWIDLSKRDFDSCYETFDHQQRSHVGPFGGYLGNVIPCYPDTFNLVVGLHLRDKPTRPLVVVAPSEHPLYAEQQSGISQQRLVEIYEYAMHRTGDG